MKGTGALLLAVAVFTSGCAHKYFGTVIAKDGTPVEGAKVVATDYPSFTNTPPWYWFVPARIPRGETETDQQGKWTIQTKFKVQDISIVKGEVGTLLRKPDAGVEIVTKLDEEETEANKSVDPTPGNAPRTSGSQSQD